MKRVTPRVEDRKKNLKYLSSIANLMRDSADELIKENSHDEFRRILNELKSYIDDVLFLDNEGFYDHLFK